MYKLAPTSVYRLHTLAQAGPRFYQVTAYMRRLQMLDLIMTNGQTDPDKGAPNTKLQMPVGLNSRSVTELER